MNQISQAEIALSPTERQLLAALLRLARPVVAGYEAGFTPPAEVFDVTVAVCNWYDRHLPTLEQVDTLAHRLENAP